MQTYQRRGGWVASFIVIAGLLGLALIGGVYYVKTHQEQAAGEPTPTEVVKQPDTTPTDDTDMKKKADSEPSKKTENKEERNDTDTSAPADEASTDPANDNDRDTDALPHTGPAENALTVLAVGALTFSGLTFIRSRH